MMLYNFTSRTINYNAIKLIYNMIKLESSSMLSLFFFFFLLLLVAKRHMIVNFKN
eukprot:UN00421